MPPTPFREVVNTLFLVTTHGTHTTILFLHRDPGGPSLLTGG